MNYVVPPITNPQLQDNNSLTILFLHLKKLQLWKKARVKVAGTRIFANFMKFVKHTYFDIFL